MRTKIVSVGKLKEAYLKDAIAEYTKRLGKYTKLEMVEVPDEKAPENLSSADAEIVKNKEGERIIAKLDDKSVTFALHPAGKMMTSEAFAQLIEKNPKANFVIGGSLGLSQAVLNQAIPISLSQMTFPHQIVRVILLEQIYRAYKINANEPYHK